MAKEHIQSVPEVHHGKHSPIIITALPTVTALSALPALFSRDERLIAITLFCQGVVCLLHGVRLERTADRWTCASIFAVHAVMSGLALRPEPPTDVAAFTLLGGAILCIGIAFQRRCLETWTNLLALLLPAVLWAQFMLS